MLPIALEVRDPQRGRRGRSDHHVKVNQCPVQRTLPGRLAGKLIGPMKEGIENKDNIMTKLD